MVSEGPDPDWTKLADVEAADREAQMADRYRELAGLSEEERSARLKSMAEAEFSLPDDKLKRFTISRMRTWITLEPEVAAPIAHSYDSVMRSMPATIAMRRVALVQTLVLEFTPEEEERLRELVPTVFAGAPSRLTGLDRTTDAAPEPVAVAASKKKPAWAFWRRG